MTLVPVPVIRFLDKGNEIIGLEGILPAGVIIITNIESGFFVLQLAIAIHGMTEFRYAMLIACVKCLCSCQRLLRQKILLNDKMCKNGKVILYHKTQTFIWWMY